MSQRRGTGPIVVDPRTIQAVFAFRAAGNSQRVAADHFGISFTSVCRWEKRRRAAAEQGVVWPSEDDIRLWDSRQPDRARIRRNVTTWRLRVARQGPSLIDSTGTARRLRALSALGWRLEDLAEYLDASWQYVARLMVQGGPTIRRVTAAHVAKVYDELSMTPGPSERTRKLAANKGWLPPLAWDDETIDDPKARPRPARLRDPEGLDGLDEIAIERAMRGDRLHLRPRERAEAVQRLTARGLSAAEIAALLDIEKRSVVRHRAAA